MDTEFDVLLIAVAEVLALCEEIYDSIERVYTREHRYDDVDNDDSLCNIIIIL